MGLKEKLVSDLKEAMKSGQSDRVAVLRMVSAALKNRAIEKKTKGQSEELDENDVLDIVGKEAKKRKESIEAFTQGGRSDLADKEKEELQMLEGYLPKQLSQAEVAIAVKRIVAGLSEKSIGPAMKAVLAELKGKADPKLISDLVKVELGS